MEHKVNHFMYVPMTGLGLYNGHRGKRWLKNRIQIFKQFVVPSLQAQTNQNFVLWVSWRYEDKTCPVIKEFKEYLEQYFKVVFTYSGVCFWDDKYPDDVARERLINAVHGSMGDLLNVMNDSDTILMTIQPSDDCYRSDMVEQIQLLFEQRDVQVIGYQRGYVMDYVNKKLCEWNPTTTPPFYTIKFNKENFGVHHPLKHLEYTGPYKSHEYVKDYLKALYLEDRGFVVGTHTANISTVFDHPYAGKQYVGVMMCKILEKFGLNGVKKLDIPFSLRGLFFQKLPYGVKRKLRYWAGEKEWIFRPIFAIIYNILRA